MKKIDRPTVQRILDTADIVDVVSDFVSLKKRGANYIGLCPFHNERTPSFSVSRSKGICKCFSCGKGGSPVNFIMELEQLSYNEALRYLARKYNIEIHEHELSDAEKQAETEREALLAVNAFAMEHFIHNLNDTSDGREIGLAYFLQRGINEKSIKRFGLGYALDRNDDLYNAAISKGYEKDNLVKTGLCSVNDRGSVYDRFRGRVIYPIQSLSGKVVAFGGRTLRSDKNVAKYVNSPESIIYKKSNELYGMYQARQAIVRQDKCILVEGYMDVISMHQSGVENVVASSGTSLTDGQVRLIHRFTENVTVIYDSDAAGIKASLRGIDLLLAEGLDIKVLLLPDGEDPDSFAQGHTSQELMDYLSQHETDFIQFKTSILLADTNGDPIRRASVITDILNSIAVIPSPIKRQIYIQECSRAFGIDEKVLSLQLARTIADRAERDSHRRHVESQEPLIDPAVLEAEKKKQETPVSREQASITSRNAFLAPFEQTLVRYAIKYGMLTLCEAVDDEGVTRPLSVFDYILSELAADDIELTDPTCDAILVKICAIRDTFPEQFSLFSEQLQDRRNELYRNGIEEIRQTAVDADDIHRREVEMQTNIDAILEKMTRDFSQSFVERRLLSDPDDAVRNLTTTLVSEKYQLSKVHTKYAQVETEDQRLAELVPRALYELKDAILSCRIEDLRAQIKASAANHDIDTVKGQMAQLIEMTQLRGEFAKYLGERIVTPRVRAK